MRSPGGGRDRQVLLEAFTAGWQAALAVNITNPRVLALVESCFDGWLQEAADEAEVLGLRFRARQDLPRTTPLLPPARNPLVVPEQFDGGSDGDGHPAERRPFSVWP